MQVLTLVLNRTECLEALLEALLKSGIHGGTVVDDAQVAVAREVINRVTGGLDRPDTGILFAVPALFVEGMKP